MLPIVDYLLQTFGPVVPLVGDRRRSSPRGGAPADAPTAAGVALRDARRRPTTPALARLVPRVVGRATADVCDRLWLRHFAATSGRRRDRGRAAGRRWPIGVPEPGRPATRACCSSWRSRPGVRRRGVGRALVGGDPSRDSAVGGVRRRRGRRLARQSGRRPVPRGARAIGPLPESVATPLYGVPAIADYDGEGEDRRLCSSGADLGLTRSPAISAIWPRA